MREEREVSVRIFTERTGFDMPPFAGVIANLFEDQTAVPEEPQEEFSGEEAFSDAEESKEEFSSEEEQTPETSEFFALGKLVETDDRVEIVYEESVLTGMEGSLTSISFSKAEPNIVSMVRQGMVDTALVFERGKRHISVYQTPFAEFELCVCALKVNNLLWREGVIELDYITELHGARTERCKMRISIG